MRKTLKVFAITALSAVIGLSFAACDDGGSGSAVVVVSVTGISLNKSTASINVGSYEVLAATVLPDDAANKDVTWTSSNSEVATVTEGVVIGISAGSAAITAITVDGERKAVCAVSVTAASGGEVEVPVTGVTLNKTAMSLVVGGTENLFAAVLPSNATNNNVTWTSNAPARATVSETGLVTGISAGSATIIVSTENGGKIAICAVTVTAPVSGGSGNVAVNGVTLNKTSASLTVGNSETLSATVAPSNATNKALTWSSSAAGVATVSASGVVTAVAAGSATIIAATSDGGKTATCAFTVSALSGGGTVAVTGVTLNKKTTSLTVGYTETLSETVAPSTATNKAVDWSSDKPAVATVSSSGLVKAVAAGSAKITVTTKDGSFKADCNVTVSAVIVNVPVTEVTLNITALPLDIGASETLTAAVSPSNATNKAVEWSSDKETVATVSDGLVTAVAAGSAKITVTTKDGSFKADCAVTVSVLNVPVTGVTLNKSSITLGIGDKETLIATVMPSNATNPRVQWSGAGAAALVTSEGVVIASSEGTAVITVKTVDGNFTKDCIVTVNTSTPATLAAYLATLPVNSPSSPYKIKLEVSSAYEFTTVKNALKGASNKYVQLNFTDSTVKEIPNSAFEGCTSLTSVSLSSATSIGNSAFYDCTNLTSVNLPKATTIGNSAFSCSYGYSLKLTSVSLPMATNIGRYAFERSTSLTSVDLPKVSMIEDAAFWECRSLTSVSLPTVIILSFKAFAFCKSLTSVSLPEATHIGRYAFEECSSLTSVILPEVFTIGEYAFRHNTQLKTVSLGSNIWNIGDDAFWACSNLTTFGCRASTPPTLGTNVFYEVTSFFLIFVPGTSVSAYWTAAGWKAYWLQVVGTP